MFRKWMFLLLLMLPAIVVRAQKRAGDFIESKSLNEARMPMVRTLQYFPAGGGFACVNGRNRYTRALYGAHTDYRIETSDRPIFAVYKRKGSRNIRMYANGVRLDSALWCKAVYANGRRSYEVVDPAWNGRRLHIDVVTVQGRESAFWRVAVRGGNVALRVVMGDIAAKRLHRNGDLGVDPPNAFDPAPAQTHVTTLCMNVDTVCFVRLDSTTSLRPATAPDYEQAAAAAMTIASRIAFTTPDPYFNTLGQALSLAAEGLWDGSTHTWLHGCVGWRMPLAGWRAAFVGDVLGWNDRAKQHYLAYAASQVTQVPPLYGHPTQDSALHLARAVKRWGTPMYSNGYICRNPWRNDQMHHYDMDLNYADELLWHFDYDADTAYMRRLWPTLAKAIEWENRNFDPDGNGLYDAYACIWASDALFYGGGEAVHSTAYNYRLNAMAARVARLLHRDDADCYEQRARRIAAAADSVLWMPGKGHWAECRDGMGLRRLHPDAALWSYYLPIDCGLGTADQRHAAAAAMQSLPTVDVQWNTAHYDSLNVKLPKPFVDDIGRALPAKLLATSNWMPYAWSINNVAPAEVMHAALADFRAGRPGDGMALVHGVVMDQMYLGKSPGNFGQISYYDAARGECYRDFGDNVGVSARTLVQGVFGIEPHATQGYCLLRPGYVGLWDSVSVNTPYLSYQYRAFPYGSDSIKVLVTATQHFAQPLQLRLALPDGTGAFRTIKGDTLTTQTLSVVVPKPCQTGGEALLACSKALPSAPALGLDEPDVSRPFHTVGLQSVYNARVADIFRNSYLSPRPRTTSLEMPTQGAGEWCHPLLTPEVNDSALRVMANKGAIRVAGVPFALPAQGCNVAYTSLWDNYPDSLTIPMGNRKAGSAYLLLVGSTNHMQSHIDNACVVARYADGSSDTLRLINPYNWCPIEQDYFVDGKAFRTLPQRPYRLCLGNGVVSRDLGRELGIEGVYGRELPGGAAEMLRMHLRPDKRLHSLVLRTLSNDVVAGIMAVTLQ